MLFVCLEIAGGEMVVMLCIAHCLSVHGNSLCEGKRFAPRKTAGWRGVYQQAGLSHHSSRAFTLYCGAEDENVSSSPHIVKPRFRRVETKAVGVLSGLSCQPYGPYRGVCLFPAYVPFGGFGTNGGGRKRITEERER